MKETSGRYLIHTMLLVSAAIMVLPWLSSCSKASDNAPNGYKTQLLVANFSPDANQVNLFTNNIKQNTSVYRYSFPSSYFYLGYIGLPLQFRTTGGSQNIIAFTDSVTRPNTKYSLFLIGMAADSSLKTIFTVDTDKVPAVGNGKMRFVNTSPHSGSLDVYANGSKLFDGVVYTKFSPYLQMPAGNYDVKIYSHGDNTTILKELNPVTIQDGRLYSLVGYGLVGHTDTAAFSATLITNK